MTRIVAGRFGGRTLAVPAKGTRPTSDRVREAIFSRLDHWGLLDGARVLDLYAGSGALGLEALSRGAAQVLLVDSARGAAQVARSNIASLGVGSAVKVVMEDAGRFTAQLAAMAPAPAALLQADAVTSWNGQAFDIVFLDPPYDVADASVELVLQALATPGLLGVDAVLVVERSARSPQPSLPPGLALVDSKNYGETAVYFVEAE